MNSMNENLLEPERETSGTTSSQHSENWGCLVKPEPNPHGCLPDSQGRIEEVNTMSLKASS